MKKSHLERALAALKRARSGMRSVADVRTIEELDNAISAIEEELWSRTPDSHRASKRALAYLGKALRLIPLIQQVMNE